MNKWWTLLLLVVFVLILPACQEAKEATRAAQAIAEDPIPEVIGTPETPPPEDTDDTGYIGDDSTAEDGGDDVTDDDGGDIVGGHDVHNLEVVPISLWSDWSQNYHHCVRFFPSFFGQIKKSLLCFYQIAVITPPPQHRLLKAETQGSTLHLDWIPTNKNAPRPWGNLRLFKHLHFLEFETATTKNQSRILWNKHSRLLVLHDSDGNLRFIRYTIE